MEYFHELKQEKIDAMIKGRVKWNELAKKYKQPKWCIYPDALMGQMGCWSLTDLSNGGKRTEICYSYCRGCVYFKITPK